MTMSLRSFAAGRESAELPRYSRETCSADNIQSIEKMLHDIDGMLSIFHRSGHRLPNLAICSSQRTELIFNLAERTSKWGPRHHATIAPRLRAPCCQTAATEAAPTLINLSLLEVFGAVCMLSAIVQHDTGDIQTRNCAVADAVIVMR
jgi:hypothetical protein